MLGLVINFVSRCSLKKSLNDPALKVQGLDKNKEEK